MTASRKPVVSWTVPQAPLTDANGHITWAWIKWFQGIQQTINSAFDQQGNFDGNLGVDVAIVSRPVTLITILQNIDDTGVVTAQGIDFARPYLNKDTDHINDGLGNPLAGGRVAYAAMVGSGPHAGQILVFDGSTWQPHAKATTIPKAVHQWLDSYNDATGTFTASQPSFVDIIGTISPSQLPVATTSTVGVVKPDGTTVTIDPDGTIHTSGGLIAGTNITITGSWPNQTISAVGGGGGGGLFTPVMSAVPTRSGIGLTTTFNTSGTFTQADNAMGITIADTVGTAGENFEGLVKAYPGSAFTLNALVAGPYTGSAFVCVGLVIMASTSGKLIFFGWRWTSSGNVWQPCVMAYTSPTAFSSFLYTPSINQFPMTGWFQIADNGTNVSFNLSTDGVFWQTVYTVSKASSFLGSSGFNYIGFAIDRSNGAIGGTLASWAGA